MWNTADGPADAHEVRAALLQYPCPKCCAAVGVRCRRPNGSVADWHMPRVRLWDKDGRHLVICSHVFRHLYDSLAAR